MPNVNRQQVVIIGGGTAGITVVARLKRASTALDITLIEPSDRHYYQPLWTLVGAGVVKKDVTERPEEDYIPWGVKWLRDHATAIDPEANNVTIGNGAKLSYDYLIVAPGIQLDWHKVAGLKETIGRNGVCSIYDYRLAEYTWQTMRAFKGGNAVFTNPATQVKCGGAPQKIIYLADDHFRRRGIRDSAGVIGAFAGTVMLGVPEINATLNRIVAERSIEMRFYHNLVAIDGAKKVATFDVTSQEGVSRKIIPFDMVHVTPPMSAPDFIKSSPLAVAEGPHQGFVEVDIHTLQHRRYPNVFALGDAAALPTAKTGAAIRKQAPVLVKNLLAVMRGEELPARYDGYSSCPLLTGYRSLVLAEFKYDNKYAPSFPVDQTKERLDMYLLKRYALPPLYWHGMLRGLV